MTQVAVRTARPAPPTAYLSPVGLVRDLWAQRELIRRFTDRDVRLAYKETYLGLLWLVIEPLLTIAVYTVVFSVILQYRFNRSVGTLGDGAGAEGGAGGHAGFAIHLFAGLVAYTLFTECVQRGPFLVRARRNLVQRVVFPLEILPLTTVTSRLIFHVVGVAVLMLAALALGGSWSSTFFLYPLVLLPLVLMTLGMTWIVASLGVYIPDIRSIVGVITRLLFFVTPIFYEIEMVPERFRWILELNPLTAIVTNARRVLLWGETPDASLLVVGIFSVIVFQVGYVWFMRSKRGFADAI